MGFCFEVCYSIGPLQSLILGLSMSTKNVSTAFAKTQTPKSNNRLKILLAAGLLLLLAVGYSFWSSSATPLFDSPASSQASSPTDDTAPIAADEVIKDDATPLRADNLNRDANADTMAGSTLPMSDTAVSADPNAIINAPLPTSDSVAKEEIDRLNDEQSRLAEQEALALEQIEMTQDLSDMKAEQIKLLEQQIAQLEADTTTTN